MEHTAEKVPSPCEAGREFHENISRLDPLNRAGDVAPIGNRLYRGLPIRDTADCQSAPHCADGSWREFSQPKFAL